MVNCNDTIQLSDINMNDQSTVAGKQSRKHAAWHAQLVFVATSIVTWLTNLQARARDRHSLEILDDRMLDDIGVTRADVADELSKSFWTRVPPRG